MRKNFNKLVRALAIGLTLILPLTGCAAAVGVLGAVGSGFVSGAEYVVARPVSKTASYDFDRVKKALLVALCKMQIPVEKVREIDHGEEIIAGTDDIEIEIELKEITSNVTRIKIKAGGDFVKRDSATAQEIVRQTTEIAETLVT
ncbi:MAG: DUF3568 family protein [Syntrophobacterales bacterium]|jgi:hypothetical protein